MAKNKKHGRASRKSKSEEMEAEEIVELQPNRGKNPTTKLPEEVHPVDKANWLSFTTFTWMSSIMYSSYKDPKKLTKIPYISILEACNPNTNTLEKLWNAEVSTGNEPRMGHVIWQAVRRRALLTTIVYLTSIIFGFLSPTLFMRKVLEFSANPNGDIWDGVLWVSLLILCEFARVFLFTLTWAMSYRTAIRLRTACMGLAYRKLLKLGNLTDTTATKITNVISSDCSRIYDIITTTQLAIGGPSVLILCVFYIVYELGFWSLFGILVFPLFSPIQFLLAKGSGSYRRKQISTRDDRITFITQALHYLKFLKMFNWERYYRDRIRLLRLEEKKYIMKAQLLQSLNIVIAPTLPHVGAIITFLIYINSGHELSPAQAFCIVALFSGRIRPSLNEIRSGFRAYFDAGISFGRLKCFTILFLFSLFGYTIKSSTQLIDFYYIYRIFIERMEEVLLIPEVHRTIYLEPSVGETEAIIFENVTITRRVPPDSEHLKNNNLKQGQKNVKLSKTEKKIQKDLKKHRQRQKKLEKKSKEVGQPAKPDVIAFELEQINLQIKKGRCIGICGQIGSGKSTFLKAITGGLAVNKGSLSINGGVAYAAQEPWLFNGTLRDNIVFGESFDDVRYYNTISACCLVSDFGMLPCGDLTETSEGGSNLSGGQKCRISLARAMYHVASRDIFVFDDPFSSLDGQVAKTIFERVVTNHLAKDKSKTLILVTHQMQFLKDCDEILVFSDGAIAERGTHRELMDRIGSVYANLVGSSTSAEDGHSEIRLEDSEASDCRVLDDNWTESESPKKNPYSISGNGKIPWSVYNLYLKNAGGFCALFVVLFAFALSVGSTTFSSWWLKQWFRPHGIVIMPNEHQRNGSMQSSESTVSSTPLQTEVISSSSPDFIFNRNVYAGIIGVIFLTSFSRTLLFVVTSIRAAQGLHCRMLSYFFRNRLKSSEKIGTGQILNLFSTDMDTVDSGLPSSLEFFLQNIFVVISILTLVTIVFPAFLIPFLLLFVIFMYIRKIYNEAIRELKRLESEAKTPIYSRVKDTINGLGTIRAFSKEDQMIRGFELLADDYHSIFYTFNSAIRWLSIRLDSLAVTVTAATAILILIFHGSVSAASAGLALSYAAQLAGIFQFTVRLATETESKFVSVERMKNFLEKSMPEEPEIFDAPSSKKISRKNPEKLLMLPSLMDVHPNWPVAGHVKFDSVYMSYSLEHEAVLRDLSFEAYPGQKIGIIGRTGSGKSSIGSALFRLTELKSGQILIDNVDIAGIPLSKLRSSLCVIPQEPAVFQHSIRFNLDPANNSEDSELWLVLEKTGLKASIENLDSECGLSQGQRQLLSIGRALLRRAKIVFVDEATSSVDTETAAVMDRLMAEEFESSTVFIVAHRLQALSYCDHLLIMEDGRLRDFGPVEVITRKPEFATHFEKFETISLR